MTLTTGRVLARPVVDACDIVIGLRLPGHELSPEAVQGCSEKGIHRRPREGGSPARSQALNDSPAGQRRRLSAMKPLQRLC